MKKVYGYGLANEYAGLLAEGQKMAIMDAFTKLWEPKGYTWGRFYFDLKRIERRWDYGKTELLDKLIDRLDGTDVVLVRSIPDAFWTTKAWAKAAMKMSRRVGSETGAILSVLDMPGVDVSTPQGRILVKFTATISRIDSQCRQTLRRKRGKVFKVKAPYNARLMTPEEAAEDRKFGREIVRLYDEEGLTYPQIYRKFRDEKIRRFGNVLVAETAIRNIANAERKLQEREKAEEQAT